MAHSLSLGLPEPMGGNAGPAVLPPENLNPAGEAQDPIDLHLLTKLPLMSSA